MNRVLRSFLAAAGLAALLGGATPAAVAASASVVTPQNQTFDLKEIPRGKYTLDLAHANILFKISHLGFSTFIGRFDAFEATLDFRSNKLEKSKLAVKIDPASVNTKVEKLDEHLRGADFFDTATYPEAGFKSTKIEKIDDRTGKVTGDLTLHGVTKPVTLDVTFYGGAPNPLSKKMTLGFSARGLINRSDFGMTKYVPMVGDTVALVIEAEFNQAE